MQHKNRKNLTKKYRISAVCRNFLNLQVLKTRFFHVREGKSQVEAYRFFLCQESVMSSNNKIGQISKELL